MKKCTQYARHRDISDFIYDNIGKFSRNILGKVELNNKEVTRQTILGIYNSLKSKYAGIVLSRIEDVLAPSYQDYRYGPYKPFAERGSLNGELCVLQHVHNNMIGVYKVHSQPYNHFFILTVKGPLETITFYDRKRDVIEAYNNILKLNGYNITVSEANFYH